MNNSSSTHQDPFGADHFSQFFINSMQEGAINIDENGIVLYCNEQFAKMLNVPSQALIGTAISKHIEPKQLIRFQKLLKSKEYSKSKFTLISNYGKRLTAMLILKWEALGPVQSYYGLVTDITKENLYKTKFNVLNKKLSDAILTKKHFLAAVNHNLRTPLNSIIGFTDTLLMQIPGPITDKQEKQLSTVKRCSSHLLSLVDRLIEFSRLEFNNINIINERTKIHEVISEVIEKVTPLLKSKKLKFDIKLMEKNITIDVDKNIIFQILFNLVDNAIKYTATGTISIREIFNPTEHKDCLEISIQDTGIGIKEENLKQIFEAYQKLDISNESSQQTGLGLYLCRKYCELLNMKLTCESIYGKGSTFTLCIPI